MRKPGLFASSHQQVVVTASPMQPSEDTRTKQASTDVASAKPLQKVHWLRGYVRGCAANEPLREAWR